MLDPAYQVFTRASALRTTGLEVKLAQCRTLIPASAVWAADIFRQTVLASRVRYPLNLISQQTLGGKLIQSILEALASCHRTLI